MTTAEALAAYIAWERDGTNDGALHCAYASARKALSPDARTALDSLVGAYDWRREQTERARAAGRAEYDAAYQRAFRAVLDASNRDYAREQGWSQ